MKEDFYSFWINVPEWTIKQFVCLLNGYDPAVITEQTSEKNFSTKQNLVKELNKWKAWVGDCPGISFQESYGKKTPILSKPMEAEILVNWANKKKGVSIPKELESLLYANKSEKVDSSLGEKEKDNLLITIALLALAVVEHTGANTGEIEKPNFSGIVELCQKHAGDSQGMKKSTLLNRISKGMKLLRELK